jgi:hypothetical protein
METNNHKVLERAMMIDVIAMIIINIFILLPCTFRFHFDFFRYDFYLYVCFFYYLIFIIECIIKLVCIDMEQIKIKHVTGKIVRSAFLQFCVSIIFSVFLIRYFWIFHHLVLILFLIIPTLIMAICLPLFQIYAARTLKDSIILRLFQIVTPITSLLLIYNIWMTFIYSA